MKFLRECWEVVWVLVRLPGLLLGEGLAWLLGLARAKDVEDVEGLWRRFRQLQEEIERWGESLWDEGARQRIDALAEEAAGKFADLEERVGLVQQEAWDCRTVLDRLCEAVPLPAVLTEEEKLARELSARHGVEAGVCLEMVQAGVELGRRDRTDGTERTDGSAGGNADGQQDEGRG